MIQQDIGNPHYTISVLPILVLSIIDVKRFQRLYDGQPAPLGRPNRWTNTTIQVHTDLRSITGQSVPLLDVLLLLHSSNSCVCPEVLPSNNIPRQARRVEHKINIVTYILQQQKAPEKLRMFQLLNKLSSVNCNELCCSGICFCVIHIPMRSSHNSTRYSGQQGVFYRCQRETLTLLLKYTGTHSTTTVVSSNTRSTSKYFVVGATRLLLSIAAVPP